MTQATYSTLSKRQRRFVDACAASGCSSLISRQELVSVCEDSGVYTSPPTWVTQDPARKHSRGIYSIPEIDEADSSLSSPVAPPVGSPPQAVPTAPSLPEIDLAAATVLGMTGGDRASLVPDRVQTYVPWGHFKSIEKILRAKIFYPVFVTGLSGNGKTMMVEQVCAKLKRECYRVNLTKQTDEDDLLGGFRLIDGNTVWCDGPVTSAMKNGGILLLDEIDLASHNIMCLQPVLEGKGVFLKKIGQWVRPAEGFTVFATANTKGKGSDDGRFIGTNVLNEAFLDRFPVTLEQEYAARAVEKKILVKAMGSLELDDEDFADHLVRWAEIIRKSFAEGAVDEIISTRRLVDITKAYSIFDDKMTAITMAISRFDDDTKEGFLSLYTKVDADALGAETDEEASIEAEASADLASAARIDLQVPYDQKDNAKSRGAKWDNEGRRWYITGSTYSSDTEYWDTYSPTAVTTVEAPF